MNGWIIFGISWPVVGIISWFSILISDQRGRTCYNHYDMSDILGTFVLLLLAGYLSIFLALGCWVDWNKVSGVISHFIWRLANPKKKGDKK